MTDILYSKQYKHFKLSELLINLTIIILISVILTVSISYFIGYRFFIVNGTSSMPVIERNGIICVYKVPKEEINKGDYVTLSFGNSFVTHRVVEVLDDNNTIHTAAWDKIDENGDLKAGGTFEIGQYDNNVVGKVLIIMNKFGQIINFALQNIISVALGVVIITLASRFINYKYNNYTVIFS